MRRRPVPFFVQGPALFVLVLFAVPAYAEDETPPSSCVTCHAKETDELGPSAHGQHGISCHECHGGDPAQSDKALAKAAATGYIGIPDKRETVQACGSCHSDVEYMNPYGLRTDQLALYKTSHHGKKLADENNERVAVCSDCHGAHDILPISDPQSRVYPANIPQTCGKCHGDPKVMEGSGFSTEVYKDWRHGVHGTAMLDRGVQGAASCASCHGSHGAVPPGVKDIGTACGKCHMNELKYFLESPHAAQVKEGLFSECFSCHSNHDIVKPDERFMASVCTDCHDDKSAEVASGREIAKLIRGVKEELRTSEEIVKQASAEGFFVDEESASLEEAKTSVIELGPLQHTLATDKISERAEKARALAKEAERTVDTKRRWVEVRKKALLVMWLFVLVMCSALWLKYKRRKHGG